MSVKFAINSMITVAAVAGTSYAAHQIHHAIKPLQTCGEITAAVTDSFDTEDHHSLSDVVQMLESEMVPEQYKRKHAIKICIELARAEFGVSQYSEANRMMVRKFLRDAMREAGMRPHHIAQHCDRATRLFFVRTKSDIETARIDADYTVIAREQQYSTKWFNLMAWFWEGKGRLDESA